MLVIGLPLELVRLIFPVPPAGMTRLLKAVEGAKFSVFVALDASVTVTVEVLTL
jgi:hypothetical protein